MRKKVWDTKWHRVFASSPVRYQSDFGEESAVWGEWVYRTYNENRAAIGADPWVYATAESLKKLWGIKPEDIK